MHDRLDHHRMNDDMSDDAALAAALQALPAATPPHGAWQSVATRAVRRRRVRTTLRIVVPAALAAGIVLALALPRGVMRETTPARQDIAQSPQTGASNVAALAALRVQSQRTQDWVRTLDRDGAPLDGDALATAVALQDRIGLIDLQLGATRDPDAAVTLWQQRIALLERLGTLHLQPYVAVQHTRNTTTNNTMIL